MLNFLDRFKIHLAEMEVEFEQGVMNTYQMNLLLKQYEQTLYANYSHEALSTEQYLVFEK